MLMPGSDARPRRPGMQPVMTRPVNGYSPRASQPGQPRRRRLFAKGKGPSTGRRRQACIGGGTVLSHTRQPEMAVGAGCHGPAANGASGRAASLFRGPGGGSGRARGRFGLFKAPERPTGQGRPWLRHLPVPDGVSLSAEHGGGAFSHGPCEAEPRHRHDRARRRCLVAQGRIACPLGRLHRRGAARRRRPFVRGAVAAVSRATTDAIAHRCAPRAETPLERRPSSGPPGCVPDRR